jgi:hypothetical protein
MEQQLKENNIDVKIDSDIQQNVDFNYVEDLKFIKKTLDSAPTLKPKKFVDQIQLVYVGGAYELHAYINNTWKKVTLT